MKIVVATDSYKGSLTSMEAGYAIAEGIHRADKNAEVIVRPVADGGEGTVDALIEGLKGRVKAVRVTGPLGDTVDAEYGIVEGDENITGGSREKTAIIEMAAAAGITLVDNEKRNPLYTTTVGVGEIINDAIKEGCRRFIVGIGGSATNDGGAGMLQALGFGLLDSEGKQIPAGAIGLPTLVQITDEGVTPELKECTFRVACDVSNPLCGEKGCSRVFGPQKGATEEMIKDMDRWLGEYAQLVKSWKPDTDAEYPGSGAAGGLGFAFHSFLGASLESGIKIVLEETGLESYIQDADLVITGEGRLDSQSVMGKAPIGVANIAKRYGKPVVALAGCVSEDSRVCNEYGIDAYFPILQRVASLEKVMEAENAQKNLSATAEQVYRLYRIYQ